MSYLTDNFRTKYDIRPFVYEMGLDILTRWNPYGMYDTALREGEDVPRLPPKRKYEVGSPAALLASAADAIVAHLHEQRRANRQARDRHGLARHMAGLLVAAEILHGHEAFIVAAAKVRAERDKLRVREAELNFLVGRERRAANAARSGQAYVDARTTGVLMVLGVLVTAVAFGVGVAWRWGPSVLDMFKWQ